MCVRERWLWCCVEATSWRRADLGHEFADADTLTTSEAKLLIDVVLTKRPKDTGEDMPMTEYSLSLTVCL